MSQPDLNEAFAQMDGEEVARHLLKALEMSCWLVDRYAEQIRKLAEVAGVEAPEPADDFVIQAQRLGYAARMRLLQESE